VTAHGTAAGTAGFSLAAPGDFNATKGALLGATPATSPLWAVLNSRAMGNNYPTTVNVGGVDWRTMPIGTPAGWNEYAHKHRCPNRRHSARNQLD